MVISVHQINRLYFWSKLEIEVNAKTTRGWYLYCSKPIEQDTILVSTNSTQTNLVAMGPL